MTKKFNHKFARCVIDELMDRMPNEMLDSLDELAYHNGIKLTQKKLYKFLKELESVMNIYINENPKLK